MTTDDERREVAARLRELGGYVFCPENTYELLADALGVEDFKGTDELFARLADLIEPSCDSDALQGLAGSLQIMAMHHDMTGQPDLGDTLRTIAGKIREALGVES